METPDIKRIVGWIDDERGFVENVPHEEYHLAHVDDGGRLEIFSKAHDTREEVDGAIREIVEECPHLEGRYMVVMRDIGVYRFTER